LVPYVRLAAHFDFSFSISAKFLEPARVSLQGGGACGGLARSGLLMRVCSMWGGGWERDDGLGGLASVIVVWVAHQCLALWITGGLGFKTDAKVLAVAGCRLRGLLVRCVVYLFNRSQSRWFWWVSGWLSERFF
jgi:hypothetical protein